MAQIIANMEFYEHSVSSSSFDSGLEADREMTWSESLSLRECSERDVVLGLS